MNEYVVTFDPGKRRDPAALLVTRDHPRITNGIDRLESPDRITHYLDIIMAEQYRDWPYPRLVERVGSIVGHRELQGNSDLVVDATGVGEVVIDIMRENHLSPIPVLTTGGSQVRTVYAPIGQVFGSEPSELRGARTLLEIHVPKEDLVHAGAVVFEQRRVQIVRTMEYAEAIRKQLEHFTGELNPRTKRKTYEAETEEVHDDFVTTYLLAAWWFTRGRKDATMETDTIAESGQRTGEWNPYDHL